MIDLGPIKINKAFFGSNRVKKAYLGETLVYEDSGGNAEDYVQSGLVLHLDAKLPGNTSGQWKDLKAGVVFTNYGAVFNKDHVYFNGTSSYLSNTTFNTPTTADGTIEVVYDADRYNSGNSVELIYMPKSTSASLAFGLVNTSKTYIWGVKTSRNKYTTFKNGSVSISLARALHNGVAMTKNGSDYWASPNTTTYIGKRSTGNYFKGKIYSIRIYNRQLTQEEVLQNLAVDNIRFNLGLTL